MERRQSDEAVLHEPAQGLCQQFVSGFFGEEGRLEGTVDAEVVPAIQYLRTMDSLRRCDAQRLARLDGGFRGLLRHFKGEFVAQWQEVAQARIKRIRFFTPSSQEFPYHNFC